MNEMKNIVILVRYYYPDMSPVAAVINKYIQVLKKDYIFHIITETGKIHFEPLVDPSINLYYISNNIHRLRNWCEEKYSKNVNNLFYRFLIFLFRARTAIMSFFAYSSEDKWEQDATYKELVKILKIVNIDVVLSVSGPVFHPHLAAKQLKEDNPQINWITLFTDPITFMDPRFEPPFYNKKKLRKYKYQTELDIYNHANYNIFVGEIYKDAILKFNQPHEKTFYFDYTLDDIRQKIETTKSERKRNDIRLIYAGSLYKGIRDPDYMLYVLSNIKDIHLDMFVRTHGCSDVVRKYESDRIVLNSAVKTDEYLRKICFDYDILVNIGNSCTNQMPSKMLEYLSTGRPILNFYYHKDVQYDLIEKYPLGINIGRNDDNVVEKVETFCREMKGKILPYEEVEFLFPDNSIAKQITILENLINS